MTHPQLMVVQPPKVDDPVSITFMYADLARSGLTPQDINAYPLDSQRSGLTGAYCIPYNDKLMWRTRHDRKVDKYLQPKNRRDIWISPSSSLEEIRAYDTLYIIEGEKKAARFLKQWPNTGVVGIGGAWNFMDQTDDGTKRLLPTLQECLRPGKKVIAIFDGDILTKAGIQMAATTLQKLLRVHSCNLEIGYPPINKGVDDWLQETENAKLSDIQFLAQDKLEESRKQLYAVLDCSINDGKLILNELNAQKIIGHYYGPDLYVDKRIGLVCNGKPTGIDHLEMECVEYMQSQINAYYKVGAIKAGLSMVLRNKQRDLVQELIRNTPWDGVPRLKTWGVEHFESDWPEWTNEWARVLITGFALRILQPGTKADKVCILAGPQAIGKSTFFEELSKFGGQQFYYACTTLASSAGDQNRTQGMMFSRSTVVDLAEGVVFETRKASMDTVKQLITQVTDEYRLPYSKSPTIEPRGYIFVGTTNRYDQLSDATGSRRYLYLRVNKIKQLPYELKLQLCAEVVAHEDEIRNSEWWVENVDISTKPGYDPEEAAFIGSAQEYVNQSFTKLDSQVEFLRGLLDSGQALKLKTGELFITAAYLAARAGNDMHDFSSANLWGRKLSSVISSPTFPYYLEVRRLRLPQLEGPDKLRELYMQTVQNHQMMLNGYVVRRK